MSQLWGEGSVNFDLKQAKLEPSLNTCTKVIIRSHPTRQFWPEKQT
jgi:hypothetical protein